MTAVRYRCALEAASTCSGKSGYSGWWRTWAPVWRRSTAITSRNQRVSSCADSWPRRSIRGWDSTHRKTAISWTAEAIWAGVAPPVPAGTWTLPRRRRNSS
ncbi:hypothetical protein [Delftia tsuruhatensis]|uniref:hypothetical protein n=1 Tax=Delftia tsuruhatensis TaxID=180282 RepID=UPI001F23F981|nr:hypothetical protein [Delftia tsuruhatensis]